MSGCACQGRLDKTCMRMATRNTHERRHARAMNEQRQKLGGPSRRVFSGFWKGGLQKSRRKPPLFPQCVSGRGVLEKPEGSLKSKVHGHETKTHTRSIKTAAKLQPRHKNRTPIKGRTKPHTHEHSKANTPRATLLYRIHMAHFTLLVIKSHLAGSTQRGPKNAQRHQKYFT